MNLPDFTTTDHGYMKMLWPQTAKARALAPAKLKLVVFNEDLEYFCEFLKHKGFTVGELD